MIKFLPELTSVVLEEIPDKVTLALEISSCQGHCVACHSPYLRRDIGEELTVEKMSGQLEENFGVNCLLFLGEGSDREMLLRLARDFRLLHPAVELAIYSGREAVEEDFYQVFDYVKVGPYIEEFGPLNERTTNQRLYYHREDITYRFWHKAK